MLMHLKGYYCIFSCNYRVIIVFFNVFKGLLLYFFSVFKELLLYIFTGIVNGEFLMCFKPYP